MPEQKGKRMRTEAGRGSGKRQLRVGTRSSQLALWQANWVKDQVEGRFGNVQVKLIRIKTSGDKIRDVPLAMVGGKGLFVKEIEEALLDRRIDLAVHSMKDVPTDLPAGLQVKIITSREDVRDAFLSGDGRNLQELSEKSVIGTASLRRQAQLLHFRQDLVFEPIRGNVGTRIRKLRESRLDGIVLAVAGLKRLGFSERVTENIPVALLLPAIGQGALGIETRMDDAEVEGLVTHLDDPSSRMAVTAERAFLKRLEGGCQVPIAALGRVEDDMLHLEGMVSSLDGQRLLRKARKGPLEDPHSLGDGLAEDLLSMGAGEILSEVYGATPPPHGKSPLR
jgi:hydroxymethylbilane synthase